MPYHTCVRACVRVLLCVCYVFIERRKWWVEKSTSTRSLSLLFFSIVCASLYLIHPRDCHTTRRGGARPVSIYRFADPTNKQTNKRPHQPITARTPHSSSLQPPPPPPPTASSSPSSSCLLYFFLKKLRFRMFIRRATAPDASADFSSSSKTFPSESCF